MPLSPDSLGPKKSPMPPPKRTSWQIWKLALSKPSLEAYQDLIRDSDFSRASIWIYVASMICLVLIGFAQILLGQADNSFTDTTNSPNTVDNDFLQIICSPLLAVLVLLIWIVLVGLIHLAGSLLGGKGSYDELAFHLFYLVGLYFALPLLTYQMILAIIALNAVHKLGWMKAIFAYFIPFIAIAMCALWSMVILVAIALSS
jgi:hypothetical protein